MKQQMDLWCLKCDFYDAGGVRDINSFDVARGGSSMGTHIVPEQCILTTVTDSIFACGIRGYIHRRELHTLPAQCKHRISAGKTLAN